MRIVFCSEPFSPLRVDSTYESEATAAQEASFESDLIDFEALVDARNPVAAIRKVKEQLAPVVAIYRGWMLKPEEYAQLWNFAAVKIPGVRENSFTGSSDGNSDQYSAGSELPESGNTSKNKSFPVFKIGKLNRTTVSHTF